ncbi:hypothetical protein [Mucilaginibacter sp.]
MKKIVLLAVAAMFSAAAFAQTTPATITSTTPPVKTQMKDLRQDVRAYDNKKAEAKAEINKGNLAAAKTDLAAAKVDKADIKADKATLKSEGIAHPVKLATKEVKIADVKKVVTAKADLKADRATEQADVKAGNITGAQAAQAAAATEKKDLKRDIREAHRDGVKRHLHKA